MYGLGSRIASYKYNDKATNWQWQWFSSRHRDQTEPGVDLASYEIGTPGSFPGG